MFAVELQTGRIYEETSMRVESLTRFMKDIPVTN